MQVLMPQFPLEIVAFPGCKMPLHIFEPRYKAMISECHSSNSLFGIVAVINGVMQNLGTSMRIKKIAKTYDDGRMDIVTQGTSVFRILEFRKIAPTKLYPEATIEEVVDDQPGDPMLADRIVASLENLYEIMRIKKSSDFIYRQTPFDIAKMLGLTLADEYQLLAMHALKDRQQRIIEHLQHIIPRIKEAENVRKRIEMNGRFLHTNLPKF